MASRTYHESVIVLRKTRLREADLILTMLAEDGRQVRAVAKGAAKPTSSFASRLEIYAAAEVLLVEGRSLDIVKEARLVDAHEPLRTDYNRSICAAPMVELLAQSTQPELPVPRLHPMADKALHTMGGCPERAEALVLAAFLLKASSILGFRPSLSHCVGCGRERVIGKGSAFSASAGGIVCEECLFSEADSRLAGDTLDWMEVLIRSTFADITHMEASHHTRIILIRVCQRWVEEHIGQLKSLSFVLSDGLA